MLPRPFSLTAYFECPFSAEESRRIPPHALVVEPLVAVAKEVSVFQRRGWAIEVPVPPHVKRQNRFVLKQNQQLVAGWERFWNASCWRRGSITILLSANAIDRKSIFQWTEYVGVWSSRSQFSKSCPTSAIRYCDLTAREDSVVVCFTASNGIQLLDLWSDPRVCGDLNKIAEDNCRHFVRSREVGKFPRELVHNTDEYRKLV